MADEHGSRREAGALRQENGKLCGMVSLGDLANKQETSTEASGALSEISSNLSNRDNRPQ